MKKATLILLAVSLLLFASACYKHTFNIGNGGKNGAEVYDKWHSHWLYGLIGDENLYIKDLCPSGNATIYERHSFLNMLIAPFTLYIYMPTTVTITCDQDKKAEIQIQITPEKAAKILTNPEFLPLVESTSPELLPDAIFAAGNAKKMLKQN